MTEWIAAGNQKPPAQFSLIIGMGDAGGLLERPEEIRAEPLDETMEEFIGRARQHYKDTREHFLQIRGVHKRPGKRDFDHFRYLAAYLVGGYSWAKIARGETPFKLPHKSEKTVAGEARKAARLISAHC